MYPVGHTVTVYHHPTQPAESVLEPGVEAGAVVASLAPFLIFSTVGLALALWGIRIVLKK